MGEGETGEEVRKRRPTDSHPWAFLVSSLLLRDAPEVLVGADEEFAVGRDERGPRRRPVEWVPGDQIEFGLRRQDVRLAPLADEVEFPVGVNDAAPRVSGDRLGPHFLA